HSARIASDSWSNVMRGSFVRPVVRWTDDNASGFRGRIGSDPEGRRLRMILPHRSAPGGPPSSIAAAPRMVSPGSEELRLRDVQRAEDLLRFHRTQQPEEPLAPVALVDEADHRTADPVTVRPAPGLREAGRRLRFGDGLPRRVAMGMIQLPGNVDG